MNKSLFDGRKSPVFAGLFFILLLTGCQNQKTPDQVTLHFWRAMAVGDLVTARRYASQDSQELLQAAEPTFQGAIFAIGQIVINADQARIETRASQTNETTNHFTTFLILEDQHWKVDYRRTRYSLSGNLFNGLFDSLKNIGENLNKQLEQQMPKLEEEVESFGQELKRQLDKLGEELEKSLNPPKKQPSPYQDSI